jgi:hypothetical protein
MKNLPRGLVADVPMDRRNRMTPLKRLHLWAVIVFVPLLSFPCPAPSSEYRDPSGGISLISYTEGCLSLQTSDAPLDKVLAELSGVAMLTILVDGALEERLTVSIDRLPLDEAMRKILRGKDTSFVYTAKSEGPPEQYLLREVRIHVPKGQKGETLRYTHEREEKGGPSRPVESPAAPDLRKQPEAKNEGETALLPDFSSLPDADRILAELKEGNLEALDDIVEGLKDENPHVQDQINKVMRSLQEQWPETKDRPLTQSEVKEELGRLIQEMIR